MPYEPIAVPNVTFAATDRGSVYMGKLSAIAAAIDLAINGFNSQLAAAADAQSYAQAALSAQNVVVDAAQAVESARQQVASNKTAVDQKAQEVETARQQVASNKTAVDQKAAEVETARQQVASNKAAVDSQTQSTQSAALLAQKYANAPENQEVEAGKFSGMHWSLKAQYWAQQSAAVATGAMVFIGGYNASSNAFPAGAAAGYMYRITTVGQLGPFDDGVSRQVGVGDYIIKTASSWSYFNAMDDGDKLLNGLRYGQMQQPMYAWRITWASEQSWRKLLTVSLADIMYSAVAWQFRIVDPRNNFGDRIAADGLRTWRFNVALVRSNGAHLTNPDTAYIFGPNDIMRVVKTGTGTYEVQIRNDGHHRVWMVHAEHLASNGTHNIIYESGFGVGTGVGSVIPAVRGAAAEYFEYVNALCLVSAAPQGVPPLSVVSTTKVASLNADMVDGYHADPAMTPSSIPVRLPSGKIEGAALDRYTPLSVATTVSVGGKYYITASVPITLPEMTGQPVGGIITFRKSRTATPTLLRQGTAQIDINGVLDTSFTYDHNGTLELMWSGTNWEA